LDVRIGASGPSFKRRLEIRSTSDDDDWHSVSTFAQSPDDLDSRLIGQGLVHKNQIELHRLRKC
jgi:hypothetical protein